MNNKANRIAKFMLVVFAVVICVPWALTGDKPAAETEVEPGFVSLFNGKDLSGWEGNTRFWSVVDGFIRGRTTADNPTKGNTFCVWRDGKLKNFILKTKFRLHNHNSCIQYRSKEVGKNPRTLSNREQRGKPLLYRLEAGKTTPESSCQIRLHTPFFVIFQGRRFLLLTWQTIGVY